MSSPHSLMVTGSAGRLANHRRHSSKSILGLVEKITSELAELILWLPLHIYDQRMSDGNEKPFVGRLAKLKHVATGSRQRRFQSTSSVDTVTEAQRRCYGDEFHERHHY